MVAIPPTLSHKFSTSDLKGIEEMFWISGRSALWSDHPRSAAICRIHGSCRPALDGLSAGLLALSTLKYQNLASSWRLRYE